MGADGRLPAAVQPAPCSGQPDAFADPDGSTASALTGTVDQSGRLVIIEFDPADARALESLTGGEWLNGEVAVVVDDVIWSSFTIGGAVPELGIPMPSQKDADAFLRAGSAKR